MILIQLTAFYEPKISIDLLLQKPKLFFFRIGPWKVVRNCKPNDLLGWINTDNIDDICVLFVVLALLFAV